MDTELLRTFIEVTQTRHFGRAADKLFITPAAVSARIRQLEQGLGVSLFYRARGNIQMTAEGERLLPHATRVLEAWALARQDLAFRAESALHLSLGASSGLWRFLLGDLSKKLLQQLPELRLRAEAFSQNELLERLLAEQLDMLLMHDLPGDGALKSKRVGELSLVLVSSKAEQDWRTALSGDYVYVDWGAAFALFHSRKLGDPIGRLNTNQANVALDYLAKVEASAYLPEQLLKASQNLYRVKEAPVFTRPLYAVYRADNEYAPCIQQVLPLLDLTT